MKNDPNPKKTLARVQAPGCDGSAQGRKNGRPTCRRVGSAPSLIDYQRDMVALQRFFSSNQFLSCTGKNATFWNRKCLALKEMIQWKKNSGFFLLTGKCNLVTIGIKEVKGWVSQNRKKLKTYSMSSAIALPRAVTVTRRILRHVEQKG